MTIELKNYVIINILKLEYFTKSKFLNFKMEVMAVAGGVYTPPSTLGVCTAEFPPALSSPPSPSYTMHFCPLECLIVLKYFSLSDSTSALCFSKIRRNKIEWLCEQSIVQADFTCPTNRTRIQVFLTPSLVPPPQEFHMEVTEVNKQKWV